MDIVIRSAHTPDVEQVGNILAEANRLYAALLPNRFQIADLVMTQAWFDEVLKNPWIMLLVAELNQKIVGLLLMTMATQPDDPIFCPCKYASIDELFVIEPYRDRGIGRLLMNRAQQWAIDHQASEIELQVWEANTQALSFYETLGYKTIRRTLSREL
jgi:ribosomal protein S18 acetylase RimI-like enzyme